MFAIIQVVLYFGDEKTVRFNQVSEVFLGQFIRKKAGT